MKFLSRLKGVLQPKSAIRRVAHLLGTGQPSIAVLNTFAVIVIESMVTEKHNDIRQITASRAVGQLNSLSWRHERCTFMASTCEHIGEQLNNDRDLQEKDEMNTDEFL